jgi:hypothetical protein
MLVLINSNIVVASEQKKSLISLYRALSSRPGEIIPTLAVVRQSDNKIDLYICMNSYTGKLTESASVRKYFTKGVTQNREKNCYPYEGLKKTLIIDSESGNTRFVYTSSGVYVQDNNQGLSSHVITYTIDTYPDLTIPLDSDILSIGTSISHEALQNPLVYNMRNTYSLYGIGRFYLPGIEN